MCGVLVMRHEDNEDSPRVYACWLCARSAVAKQLRLFPMHDNAVKVAFVN